MSGGGAMRAAAAKVAGITVANSGFRGIVPEHPVSSAARKAVRPVSVSGISSASDHLKSSAVSASQSSAVDEASMQRSCWELDDWEFAGGKEEEMVAAGEPLPRLVFGGAPSLQEAKEATFDLKDALHKYVLISFLSNYLFPPGYISFFTQSWSVFTILQILFIDCIVRIVSLFSWTQSPKV